MNLYDVINQNSGEVAVSRVTHLEAMHYIQKNRLSLNAVKIVISIPKRRK